MTLTDDQLRDALAPLRADEPTAADVAAVLAVAATHRPPARRRGRRLALALAAGTATAAVVAGVALLPGDVEREADRASAGSTLQAAAAVAAGQPRTTAAGFRYTEWLEHWHWPAAGRMPEVEIEQRSETWVDASGRGEIVAQPARVIQGGEAGERSATKSGPYRYGDAPRPKLEQLPTEPEALRDALVATIRSANWAPGLPTPDELHYYLLRDVVHLLGDASITPPLRAALFGVLARMPGVEPAPEARDALGRSGQAVRVPTRRGDGAVTVIFERETSQMLFWSEIGSGGGTPDQEHTIVRAAQVGTLGERP